MKDGLVVRPGDVVRFTLTFSGVVVRNRGGFVDVRTKNRAQQQITHDQIVEIVDPEPPEDEVVRAIACKACGVVAGQQCTHKQKPERRLKHPHQERINAWIQLTGWNSRDA